MGHGMDVLEEHFLELDVLFLSAVGRGLADVCTWEGKGRLGERVRGAW